MEWMPRKTREGRGREVFLFGNPTKKIFGAVGATGTNHPNSTGHMQSIFLHQQLLQDRCIYSVVFPLLRQKESQRVRKTTAPDFSFSPTKVAPASSSLQARAMKERYVYMYVGATNRKLLNFSFVFNAKHIQWNMCVVFARRREGTRVRHG